jgi:Domain of unknown function (DUF4265)
VDSAEALTKVYVDLPNHWASGGESLWARDLGDGLYEIRNVPFHAYGLNFLDVVEATEDAPDRKPEVRRVVRASGDRTLRVFFREPVPDEQRLSLLESLNGFRASHERATSRYFAIDVEPEGDYAAVCGELAAWEAKGLLDYETCEERAEGRFDEGPEPSPPGQ